MIQVLVVEDESPILRGICKIIVHLDSHFEIKATAYNTKEAIEYLTAQSNSIDLVITDICMPGQNGIFLLKWIRENKLPIEVIIISGYEDFKFAQQALQYGVFDYILKPVNKVQLKTVLNKVSEHIKDNYTRNFQQQLANIIHLHDITPAVTVPFLKSSTPTSKWYTLLYLCAGSYPIGIPVHSSAQEYIFATCQSYVDQLNLNTYNTWFIKGSACCECLFVFSNNEDHCIEEVSNMLFERGKVFPCPFSVFISSSVSSLDKLPDAYQSLIRFAKKKIIFGESTLLFQDIKSPEASNNYVMPPYLKSRILCAIEESNLINFQKAIRSLFEKMEVSKLTQQNIERTLNLILFFFYQKEPLSKTPFSDAELFIADIITNSTQYTQLCDNYFTMIEELFFSKESKKEKEKLMAKISLYIEQSIAEDLSTRILSNKFRITSSYLAKRFKEYSGFTPIAYITKLRIDKAKELLLTSPDDKAQDIAHIIGYPDALYFSRIFKKEVGVSPSQYRIKASDK